MNTFIARKDNGSKVDYFEGRAFARGLNSEYEAKFCTCDENTANTSEILDWSTAENVGNLQELKTTYVTARNACDANTKAALKALEDILKFILSDMR